MITVDTLRRCSFLNSLTLESLLRKSYPDDMVLSSEFLGVTNGGEFVYNIMYPDADSKTGTSLTKIFVRVNNQNEVEAEY